MKNIFKFLGIVVLAAAIVFSMTACGGGGGGGNGGDPTSITYTSSDSSGNSYALEITKATNRAVYVPQTGDSYILTVKNSSGTIIAKSEGTVTYIGGANNNFTLTPDSGTEITLTISGGGILTISGTIPGVDGSADIENPTVNPPDPPSSAKLAEYGLTVANLTSLNDAAGVTLSHWIETNLYSDSFYLVLIWANRNKEQFTAVANAMGTIKNEQADIDQTPDSDGDWNAEGTKWNLTLYYNSDELALFLFK